MSNYEISKSSLISLKAEIIKKQEEARQKGYINVKKKVPLIIKNKGVEKRNEKDSVEDLDLHQKSREVLEMKAKLYEKLSKSKIVDDDPSSAQNRYLVRFKDKINTDEPPAEENEISDIEEDAEQNYTDPENSDEEWVEYIDCLGRTRTCLKKDLQHFKSRDKEYEHNDVKHALENNKNINENVSIKTNSEQELSSEDMRKVILREQWEKEERELRDKDNIHYQDILFNEARSHGVGYYSFSKQEGIRRQQQLSLEKLRLETQQEQKKFQELKSIREQQLAARLKAAKMRKRARLGLPVEEEEDEEPEIGPPIPPAPEKSEEEDSREKLLEEARKNHIRPWDVGKIKVGEFYEYSQEEWVEKKRNERIDEFAPPSTSRRDFRAVVSSELKVSESGGSLRFSTKKTESNKLQFKNIDKSQISNKDLQDPYNEETRSFQPFTFTNKSSNKRKYEQMESIRENGYDNPDPVTGDIKMNCSFGNKKEGNISQVCTQVNRQTIEEKNCSSNEYIAKLNGLTTEAISQDIEASIEVGLKFLRNQAEQKESVRDYENDDMFAL
ncbi:hypothetical protein WA026_007502 [Henosepilachna vigintioctopunctata]|uniref:CCDC174 alpha/beta GRSR domain-containing protein n=1 Tax=Henosepilachna vigintioctopunctata TaxID=420089 RepID=A0AAW1UNG1_9CUCU